MAGSHVDCSETDGRSTFTGLSAATVGSSFSSVSSSGGPTGSSFSLECAMYGEAFVCAGQGNLCAGNYCGYAATAHDGPIYIIHPISTCH